MSPADAETRHASSDTPLRNHRESPFDFVALRAHIAPAVGMYSGGCPAVVVSGRKRAASPPGSEHSHCVAAEMGVSV